MTVESNFANLLECNTPYIRHQKSKHEKLRAGGQASIVALLGTMLQRRAMKVGQRML